MLTDTPYSGDHTVVALLLVSWLSGGTPTQDQVDKAMQHMDTAGWDNIPHGLKELAWDLVGLYDPSCWPNGYETLVDNLACGSLAAE